LARRRRIARLSRVTTVLLLVLTAVALIWSSLPERARAQSRPPDLDGACLTTNPYLATSCFNVQMDPRRPMSTANAVVLFHDTPDDGSQFTAAYWRDTGSVWGLAYRHADRTLYAGAFHKRYVSFGPGGPGAVYGIDLLSRTVTTTLIVPNAGPNYHDTTFPSDDEVARDWAGKTSLGDVDTSEDGRQLFVMNLADRRIYRFELPSGALIGSFAHGASGESWSDDARPFGLKFYNGRLYHAVVNSAESTQRREDLEGRVYSSLPDGSDMRLEAAFPLDYTRGFARVTGLIWAAPIEDVAIEWLPWRDGYNHLAPDRAGQAVYPQPMVADIEFDEQGDMVVALRDRQLDMTLAEQIIIRGRIEKPGFGAGDVVRIPRVSRSWGDADPAHYYGRTSIADASALGGLAQLLLTDEVAAATVALRSSPGTRIVVGRSTWYENPSGNRVRHEDIRCGQFALPDDGTFLSALPMPRPQHNEWSPAADLGDFEVLCGEASTPTPTPSPTPTVTPTPPDTPTPTPSLTPSTPTVTLTPSLTPRPTHTPTPHVIYLPIAIRQSTCYAHADIALVLDMSTSMKRLTSGGRPKVEAAMEAARYFARLLELTPNEFGDYDQVAIVGFNNDAWIEVGLTNDLLRVEQAIDALPGGMKEGTRLDLAFEVGQQAASGPGHRPDNEPVLILLTDGLPNRVPVGPGGSQEETVLAAAAAAKAAGTMVFTIGLGSPGDINAQLLTEAASRPDMYFYAPDGEDLEDIYRSIAGQLPCPGEEPWPPRGRHASGSGARPDGGNASARGVDSPHATARPGLDSFAYPAQGPGTGIIERRLQLVAEIGGATEAVALEGDTVYLGVGGRVMVFDVAHPASLDLIGESEWVDDGVRDLQSVEGRLFVLGSSGTLHVLDTGTREQPREVGSVTLSGTPRRMEAVGELLYVACGDAGLAIVDVSDATLPRVLSQAGTRLPVRDVAVRGSMAFLAESDPWESGLGVLDLSTVDAPAEVGFVYTPGGADAIEVHGERGYVLGTTGVMWVVGLDDPTQPVRNGVYGYVPPAGPSLPVQGDAAFDLTMLGDDYVAVAHGDGGLDVVDVRFPGRPLLAGNVDTPGSARAVAVNGRRKAHAFVADWSHGLRVIDLADEGAPEEVASYETPGSSVDFDASDSILGSAERGSRFRVLDLSNTDEPGLLGVGDVKGDPVAVALVPPDEASGEWPRVLVGGRPTRKYERVGRRYVMRSKGGLTLHRLRPPGIPKELAKIDDITIADLASDGDWAYASVNNALPSTTERPGVRFRGFRILDLAPRRELEILGELQLDGTPGAMALDSDRQLAFVAATSRVVTTTLWAIDVSVPTEPKAVGTALVGGPVHGLEIDGDRVLLATGESNRLGGATWSAGLHVVDARDPSAMSLSGSLEFEGGALDVAALADGLAIVTDDGGSVVLVDTSLADAMSVLDSYSPPTDVACTVVAPGASKRLYVGCDPSTVLVFDVVERMVTPTPTSTPSPTITPLPTDTATPSPTPTPRAMLLPMALANESLRSR